MSETDFASTEEFHWIDWDYTPFHGASPESLAANGNAAIRTLQFELYIQSSDIVNSNADCVVNAANEHLAAGGGVCGAIFRAAGHSRLQAACDKIGHCNTGSAVITPGFNMKNKFIIHAVGPRWYGGEHGEEKFLYSAYMESLKLARANDCHSIAFPLISSGIFGYPVDKAWDVALAACVDFVESDPNYFIVIEFAIRGENTLKIGSEKLSELHMRKLEESFAEGQRIYQKTLLKGWHPYSDGTTIGTSGSEDGNILADEEYKDLCHITLEKCKRHDAVTCGIYGAMMHTAFCDTGAGHEMYASMKHELEHFCEQVLNGEISDDQQSDFFEYFTRKY